MEQDAVDEAAREDAGDLRCQPAEQDPGEGVHAQDCSLDPPAAITKVLARDRHLLA
jgi:hypothetical protein